MRSLPAFPPPPRAPACVRACVRAHTCVWCCIATHSCSQLHNGGGTGWGEAINGGFLLCMDGSSDAARRAEQMLHWDVFNGVARRAWAGNSNALSYTKQELIDNTLFSVQHPHQVDPAVLREVVRDGEDE